MAVTCSVKNTFLQLDSIFEMDSGAMSDSVLEHKSSRCAYTRGRLVREWQCGALEKTNKNEMMCSSSTTDSLPTLSSSFTVDSLPSIPTKMPSCDWDFMDDTSDEVETAEESASTGLASFGDAESEGSGTKDIGACGIDWEDAGLTTLMMRNVPFHYSQCALMMEINREGFLGCFDFFYVPKEPRTRKNRGFAFLNFESTHSAKAFYDYFNGRWLQNHEAEEPVSVVPAVLQGFEANARQHASVHPGRRQHSQPVFFKDLPSSRFSLLHRETVVTDAVRDVVMKTAMQYVTQEVAHVVQQTLEHLQPQLQTPIVPVSDRPFFATQNDWPSAMGACHVADSSANAMVCQHCVAAKQRALRFCTFCGSRCS